MKAKFNIILGMVTILGLVFVITNYHYFIPARSRAENALKAYTLHDEKLNRTLLGISCDKQDTIYYKFTAKNQNNQIINGVVCMGVFKGATVRVN